MGRKLRLGISLEWMQGREGEREGRKVREREETRRQEREGGLVAGLINWFVAVWRR